MEDVGVLYAAVDMSKKKKKSFSATDSTSKENNIMEDVGDVSAAEGNLAVYAAVDKSKKKKKKDKSAITDNHSLCTEVDKSVKSSTTGDAAEGDKSKDNGSGYSKSDKKFELIPTEGFISSKIRGSAFFKFKALLCILAALLAVMTLICFVVSVYAGTKIANLESALESLNTEKCSNDSNSSVSRMQNFTFFDSCAAASSFSSLSGYYWVRASNDSAMYVYCDMTRSCGNVTGGWMRVADLDMRDSRQQCPGDLRQRNYTVGDNEIRACIKKNQTYGCSTTMFRWGISYSKVCGKIIGYQVNTTNAFADTPESASIRPRNKLFNRGQGLDDTYMDGVSLTFRNSTRQHIWTFAAALDRTGNIDNSSRCPCDNGNVPPQNFVGADYFCDTGILEYISSTAPAIFPHPLWNGTQCTGSGSRTDSSFFYKDLARHTTSDIEMRVCRDEPSTNEDVAIESVQIYVQ